MFENNWGNSKALIWKEMVVPMVAAFLLVICIPLYAADEEPKEGGDGESPALFERPIYVAIKPAFVVNYGGEGKLKYMKVEISLRVENTHSSHGVRHHMPLLRDYLVSLFSRQMDEDISTTDGKERLRVAALEGVQKVLMDEDGEQGVKDLFFNHFVVQR